VQKAYLEELPLFKDLTLEEKAELEALFEPTSFEAREAILKEDGPENYLYVLTSGVVEVNKEVFLGRLQHLATVEAPTVVGEIGLMTNPRRQLPSRPDAQSKPGVSPTKLLLRSLRPTPKRLTRSFARSDASSPKGWPAPRSWCGRKLDVGVRPTEHYAHAHEPTYEQEK
jgi:CRP-like cAMP-binding protein